MKNIVGLGAGEEVANKKQVPQGNFCAVMEWFHFLILGMVTCIYIHEKILQSYTPKRKRRQKGEGRRGGEEGGRERERERRGKGKEREEGEKISESGLMKSQQGLPMS